MPRNLGETLKDFAIRTAWEYGHFWSPDNPDGPNVRQADLGSMALSDPVVIGALRSFSQMQATEYTVACLKHHDRQPAFDGQLGPALEDTLLVERCAVPDYAPPLGVQFAFDDPLMQSVCQRMQANATQALVGSGSWAGCHGVGQFHAAIVRWDQSKKPAFITDLLKQILKNVQLAYAAVGLLLRFTDINGRDMLTGDLLTGQLQITASWVTSSSGWIGLAIVGQNETCSTEPIFQRYLASYKGGTTASDIVTQQTSLLKHETGHNCGLHHSSGGVMNPSIVNGLPTHWSESDPSTPILRKRFGGVQVPIPGGGGEPPTRPTPPTTMDQQLRDIQIKNVVQDVTIDWCVNEIRKLKGAAT